MSGSVFPTPTINWGTSLQDPTGPTQIATKEYVDAKVGGIPEAPTDGQTYGRDGQTATWNALPPGSLASSTTPLMDGTASPGVATAWSRGDHVHPTDTSRYAASNPSGYVTSAGAASASPVQSVATRTGAVTLTHTDITDWATTLAPYALLASPTFTGSPSLPTGTIGVTQTAGTSNTTLATTAFVQGAAGVPASAAPLMDGTAAVGTSLLYARQDHIHPTDTSRAPIGSPAFTGTPTAPTAVPGTNTTQIATTAFVTAAIPTVQPATVAPLMDGLAAVGTSLLYARQDHVHPSDTSRAPLASPALTGAPTAPTPVTADNSTAIATTAFVKAQGYGAAPSPATVAPLMNGTAAVGTSLLYARQDHVHPTDTSLAPLGSPALTGTPTAPTATAGTNTTQIATTAFVSSAITTGTGNYLPLTGGTLSGALTLSSGNLTLSTGSLVTSSGGANLAGGLSCGPITTTGTTMTMNTAGNPFQFLRPNAAGQKGITWSVAGGGPLDTFTVTSLAASFSGTLGVTGTTTVAGLTATGTVSGAGFSNYLASPPAIGSATPSTGAFTTLSTSGLATIASATMTGPLNVTSTGSTASRSVQDRFAEVYDIRDYGADPTGAADSAPAFRAVMGSNRRIIVPPGTYLLNSTVALPAPYVTFAYPGVLAHSFTNFTIEGYGATITFGTAITTGGQQANQMAAFMFDRCSEFTVEGLTLNMNTTGLTIPSQPNVGMAFASCTDFLVSDIHVAGNVVYAMDGDWFVNGHFRRVIVDSCIYGFDVAYLYRCLFDNCQVTGSDLGGVPSLTHVGNSGFSVIVDPSNASNNFTAIPTASFTAHNTYRQCSATNFSSGWYATTGRYYTLQGNRWFNNPGVGTNAACGILLGYDSTNGVGAPISNVVISDDDVSGNGANVSGWGLMINNAGGSDYISDITIVGCQFDNNTAIGIGPYSTVTNIRRLQAIGNSFSGSLQTTDIASAIVPNFTTIIGATSYPLLSNAGRIISQLGGGAGSFTVSDGTHYVGMFNNAAGFAFGPTSAAGVPTSIWASMDGNGVMTFDSGRVISLLGGGAGSFTVSDNTHYVGMFSSGAGLAFGPTTSVGVPSSIWATCSGAGRLVSQNAANSPALAMWDTTNAKGFALHSDSVGSLNFSAGDANGNPTGSTLAYMDSSGNFVLTAASFLANSGEISVGASGLVVAGNPVVGSRITGYGTPTGPVKLASFPGASATLAQTSAMVAQLITDLKTHGLLGA